FRAGVLVVQSKQEKIASEQARRLLQQAGELLAKTRERLASTLALSGDLKGESERQLAEVWAATANLAELQNDHTGADTALTEAAKQLGDIVPLRQVKAQLWLTRSGANAQASTEAKKILGELAVGIEKFSPQEQGRLLSTLAEGHCRLGNLREA